MAVNMNAVVEWSPDAPGLALYAEARAALAKCARVDEAREIRDKAAALAAYLAQRDDKEMTVNVKEIYVRACQRIGALSAEMDKAQPDRGHGAGLPASGKTKAATLAEAGISTSTAARYEELAGVSRDQKATDVGAAAAEEYFAEARAAKEPATMDGLRGAVRTAIRSEFGEPKPKKKRAKVKPPAEFGVAGPDPVYLQWAMATKDLALMEFDPARLVARAMMFPQLVDLDRERCMEARKRIGRFLVQLDKEKSK